MTSNAVPPVWLTGVWERKKTETAARIARAVSKLRADGCEVTYASICAAVRAIDGISISPNTIKRNDGAYEIYVAHRRPQRRRCLPEPLLAQAITAASSGEKRSLRSRIVRFRRETKDTLIARLLRLEGTVKQQKAAENALRDEVLRLSVNAGIPRND
jgi:hypothetical protein